MHKIQAILKINYKGDPVIKSISKKRISLLLSLIMIISSFPLAGVTAFAVKGGDYEYTVLEDGTAEITFYYGNAETVEIPAEIDGHKVVSLAKDAFVPEATEGDAAAAEPVKYDRSGIKKVIIPETVESIDAGYAFDSLKHLENIEVNTANEKYSSQDGILFDKNKTELLRYPEGKAGTYVIPDSVTSIGEYAFGNCDGLTSVLLPENVASVGDRTFKHCDGLTDIYVLNKACGLETSEIPAQTVIHGYSGSTAEDYAKAKGNKFAEIVVGDVSGDGKTLETVK